MSILGAYGRGDTIGRELFELFSPSTVMAMMKRVDNSTAVLWNDMETSGASPSLIMSFGLFKQNWENFFESHQGWFARGMNTTYDLVESFGAQLDSYRRAFLKEGGKTSVPPIKVAQKASVEMSPMGIALVVAGGALLYSYFTRR